VCLHRRSRQLCAERAWRATVCRPNSKLQGRERPQVELATSVSVAAAGGTDGAGDGAGGVKGGGTGGGAGGGAGGCTGGGAGGGAGAAGGSDAASGPSRRAGVHFSPSERDGRRWPRRATRLARCASHAAGTPSTMGTPKEAPTSSTRAARMAAHNIASCTPVCTPDCLWQLATYVSNSDTSQRSVFCAAIARGMCGGMDVT
jgi:hypothetical protein